jgi:hypothetical protein
MGLLSELDIDNVRLSLLIKVSRLDCSLFYDAFSVTKTYIASNKRVTSKLWFGKDLEESGRDLILRYYPGIHLQGLRETTKNLSQDSRSPDRDINPGPPEYEGVLTIRSQRSVTLRCVWWWRIAPLFLYLGTTWRKCSALSPGGLNPGESVPVPWIGGWVDCKTSQDEDWERHLLSLPGTEPRSSRSQSVTVLTVSEWHRNWNLERTQDIPSWMGTWHFLWS